MKDLDKIDIIEEENEFKAAGLDSFLKFTIRNNVMLITSTYTAVEHRGKGIAAKLTKHAINYAKDHGYQIIPICSYVDKYMRTFGYEDLIYSTEEE